MADLIDFLAPRSGVDFVIVSLLMGGMAAFATGRALAATWRPSWHLVVSMLGLAAVVRFCHFALFEDTLLGAGGYLRDFAITLGAAWLGYRHVRVRQMLVQYAWLNEPAGPLRWKARISKCEPLRGNDVTDADFR